MSGEAVAFLSVIVFAFGALALALAWAGRQTRDPAGWPSMAKRPPEQPQSRGTTAAPVSEPEARTPAAVGHRTAA